MECDQRSAGLGRVECIGHLQNFVNVRAQDEEVLGHTSTNMDIWPVSAGKASKLNSPEIVTTADTWSEFRVTVKKFEKSPEYNSI